MVRTRFRLVCLNRTAEVVPWFGCRRYPRRQPTDRVSLDLKMRGNTVWRNLPDGPSQDCSRLHRWLPSGATARRLTTELHPPRGNTLGGFVFREPESVPSAPFAHTLRVAQWSSKAVGIHSPFRPSSIILGCRFESYPGACGPKVQGYRYLIPVLTPCLHF
jgi:hypothetical protein